MAAEDDLPTGNLHLTERTYRLLRRDYFFSGLRRPTDENPLFLNLTGYLAIALIVLAFGSALLGHFGLLVPGVGLLFLPLLGVFLVFFVLHLVLSIASVCWRLGLFASRTLS